MDAQGQVQVPVDFTATLSYVNFLNHSDEVSLRPLSPVWLAGFSPDGALRRDVRADREAPQVCQPWGGVRREP